jgi:hypothetical protein
MLLAGTFARAEDGPQAPVAAPAGAAGQVEHAEQDPAAPEQPAELLPPRSIYDAAFDEARVGWMRDPLRHIEGDMSHCVGELTAFKTDRPVQQRQDKIADRLDAIIKQLEKECSGGGGGGANPSSPLARSTLAKGPGGQGEMHDPKAGDKQWAGLPPKQREQILQSRTEGFPPGFESLLQSYYQRLAQEQLEEPDAAKPDGSTEGEAGAEAPARGDSPAAPNAGAGEGAQ